MLPEYELIQSIKQGHDSGINDAFARGATVEAECVSGLSALEVAQKHCQLDAGRELIKRGADIHKIIGRRGDTLMHRAARTGDIGFTTLLLEHGAFVDPINRAGKSPLHYAARGGYQYLVKALIDAGAFIDRMTPQGDTALHLAAKNGSLAVLKSLIAAGADTSLTNNTGYTALHEAAAAGQTEAVTLLIDKCGFGPHTRATLLPRVRLAAELHGHTDTAQVILAAEATADPSPSFRGTATNNSSMSR